MGLIKIIKPGKARNSGSSTYSCRPAYSLSMVIVKGRKDTEKISMVEEIWSHATLPQGDKFEH